MSSQIDGHGDSGKQLLSVQSRASRGWPNTGTVRSSGAPPDQTAYFRLKVMPLTKSVYWKCSLR